jgi:hypothetical protein
MLRSARLDDGSSGPIISISFFAFPAFEVTSKLYVPQVPATFLPFFFLYCLVPTFLNHLLRDSSLCVVLLHSTPLLLRQHGLNGRLPAWGC